MSNKTLRVDFSTSEHSPFRRAIGRAMYHNQGLFSKLNVAQIRHQIRQALKLNTSGYLPENQLAHGNVAIQRTLDAILQPGTVRDPLRMNLAILVEQCMEEAADEFAEQILEAVARTDVALAMIDGKGEE